MLQNQSKIKINSNYNNILILIITQGDTQKVACDVSIVLYIVLHADYGKDIQKIPSRHDFL